MSKNIRVALAGAGAFGIKHLDAIKLIDGVQVTSLVSRELDKTREVAARYGIGHCATELADSLARPDVDAVILCTPTQMHAEQSVACLRAGMKLINSPDTEQQSIIESINTVLTDAFMSKTEPIDQEVLAALSQRLANLEDYVTDTDLGRELPLDAESIEMVLGIDTSGLNLVTGEGSPDPSDDIKAWMQSLLLGSWHRLDHNGNIDRVQFCWRSAQSQLYLFVSSDGNAYLFQRKGLAAYLNTALLLPAEEEALTVIATREALGKIEANPSRMIGGNEMPDMDKTLG